jgi:hypothetical protein
MFRWQKTLKKKRIKLYTTLAHTALLYGSENWTRDARDKRRVTATKTKCMSNTAWYTWADYKTNRDWKELNMTPVLDKIQEYKRSCLQHVQRILRCVI